MKRVTKDQFFAAIGPQNVHPVQIGPFPYTSEFKTPAGRMVGKIVDRYSTPPRGYPILSDYFLIEDAVQ